MIKDKIYFKHGTMFSGKTLNLISFLKTCDYDNANVIVLKPAKDTRDITIKSRMSDSECNCIAFSDNDDLISLVLKESKKRFNTVFPDFIVIDEVQFCTPDQIYSLDDLSVYAPILCYGLKTSYTGELFPAISALLAIAEDVQEIKSTCSMCKRKATHNLLLVNNKPIYKGDQILIETSKTEYKKVCRYHFSEPILQEEKDA